MKLTSTTPPADDVPLPCADKLDFDTKRQAKAAATVAQYQHGSKLHAYRCRHCQLWHLSSASNTADD